MVAKKGSRLGIKNPNRHIFIAMHDTKTFKTHLYFTLDLQINQNILLCHKCLLLSVVKHHE